MKEHLTIGLAGALFTAACSGSGDSGNPPSNPPPPPGPPAATPPSVEEPVAFNDVPVHDPSVARTDDGTFYVIGSHLAMAKSDDLVTWEPVADGVSDDNPLFDSYETEVAEGIAWTGGHVGSWASDIIRLADGRWYLYYNHCATADDGECDAPRSYLGVAVADDIEGPYSDLGIFLRSGQTDAEIDAGYGVGDTDSFDGNIHPNVIDPALFHDARGTLWMTYGSYSGGIFILEMDETTGMPVPGQGYGKHLTGGFFSAIEGSYVLYSPQSDYYYLFVSFGGFAAADGYNIRIARSRQPDGPYLDAEGNDMATAAGPWEAIEPFGVKLMGGFIFEADVGDSGGSRGYLSPGHNSAYYDEDTGRHFLITHTRFPGRGEEHAIRVHELFVNAEGWLAASPHRYVPISGDNVVSAEDLAGDYKLIDHGKDIDREAKRTVYVSLTESGDVGGEATGSWELDDTGLILNLDGHGEFEGVTRWQWDATLESLVPVFTALSDEGISLWGSRMETRDPAAVVDDIAEAITVPERFAGEGIDLPSRGTRGAQIVWETDNPDVIKPDGTVIRPNVGEGDRTVGLSATIMLNGEETTVTRFVTVPARSPFNRIARWDFEGDLAEGLGNFAAAQSTGDRIWKTGGGAPAFAAGHDGQALRLDGGTGVRLPDGLIANYEYSVSFWANPAVITAFTPAFFAAVNEQDEGGDPFSENWVSLVPESWDGNTMLWSGSDPFFDGSAGERIPENAWSHLAFSVDEGLVRVYVDGEEKFGAGSIADFFTFKGGRFALGVNYWDPPFNGLLDELKIYDAALSAGEIAALDIDYLPPAGLLAEAADLLDLGDVSAVEEDIHLPGTGPFAAAVAWVSSDPSVIAIEADTGVVTRPAEGEPAASVTLTATLTLTGESTSKDFAVTVSSL